MRCSIISASGQVLATGQLFIQEDATGELRLSLRTDGGRIIEGGHIDASGDLTNASKELSRGCFRAWGMTGITLISQLG
jgi:hypothetical protein